MNAVKITIKMYNGTKPLLETTSETYKEDLIANKDKLDLWWGCEVEYEDGEPHGYDSVCPFNGRSPRRVINVNGRNIYARYNFTFEHKNVLDDLMRAFDEDFKTKEQPPALEKQEKERKQYLMQTHSPESKALQPEETEAIEELKDEE